jgi:hypothetical protein
MDISEATVSTAVLQDQQEYMSRPVVGNLLHVDRQDVNLDVPVTYQPFLDPVLQICLLFRHTTKSI